MAEKKPVMVSLVVSLIEIMDNYKKETGLSRSALIRLALYEYFEKRGKIPVVEKEDDVYEINYPQCNKCNLIIKNGALVIKHEGNIFHNDCFKIALREGNIFRK